MEALRLTHVSKAFGDRRVVDGFSLAVRAGEAIGLFGPSGSGKTTLLRLIAGLEAPDEGEIFMLGRVVAQTGRILVPPASRDIGFVFQDLALWPHMRVAESLDFVLRHRRVSKEEPQTRIRETLEMVRISSVGKRYPHELSGGEQQRAALARALVSRPRVLLLDEPLSNLDAALKKDLLKELAALHRGLGFTLVYVTHDATETAALVSRVAVIRDGRLVDAKDDALAPTTDGLP